MSQQNINNTPANSGQGDTLFSGSTKINDNFTELYTEAEDHEVRIVALEADIAVINPQIVTLNTEVATIQTDITTIQSDIDTIEDDIIIIQAALVRAYMRLTGGTSRGSTNTNVVCYANVEENNNVGVSPLPFQRVQDFINGDHFLINVSGLYSLSMSGAVAGGVNQTMELRANPAGVVDNNVNDAFSRANAPVYPVLVKSTACPGVIYLPAGSVVWGYLESAPTAARYENQFAIAGPF